jgi:hypothetical protein
VTKFTDNQDIAWWARGYVYVALQQGIINGYPNNTYGSLNDTTRAEGSAMISNFRKSDSLAK